MTTYSKSDLATRALRQPGLYGPDEVITGEDQEDAETMCEALVETLAEMEINIPNGSVNVVPAAWLIPLANYIGVYLLESFGGSAPTLAQIEGALMPLRRMSAEPATGAVLASEHF